MPSTPIGGAHSEGNGDNRLVTVADIINQHDQPSLPKLCAQIHGKLEAFLNAEPQNERIRAVQAKSWETLGVIEGALSSYNLDEISLSYNGGKDCLILLILYLSALHTHYTAPHHTNSLNRVTSHPSNSTSSLPEKLNSVYIIRKHPFPEVENFVQASVRQYHLSLARYAKGMKEAFTDYLQDYPNIRAIFVGTRRTDPHGAKLTHFDRTDGGWPDFMRIHPVIDWHYAQVWVFLRELGVPYCELYDLGYTSLGGTMDTFPNPALKYNDSGGGGGEGGSKEQRFRPAYELMEDDEERKGRQWSPVDDKKVIT